MAILPSGELSLSFYPFLPIQQMHKRDSSPLKVIDGNLGEEINCLAKIPEGFVSGKVLQQWSAQGTPTNPLKPRKCKNKRYWVHALRSFPDGSWASGTRDGWINFWDAKGHEISSRPVIDRQIIHCIAGEGGSVYVGIGNKVCLFGKKHFYQGSGEIRSIDILDDKSLVVGCGSDLEIWTGRDFKDKTFGICESLEDKTFIGRPQISAFACLESDPSFRAVGFSNGSLKIIDLHGPGTIKIFKEHFSAIRCVVNLSAQYFATCSDDRMIKIWDLRAIGSALTIDGNTDSVTALLKLDEIQFISSAKSQIAFWDTRMV